LYIMGDRRVFMKKKWYLPTKGAAIGIVFVFVMLIAMFVWGDYTYYVECEELCKLYGERCNVIDTRYGGANSWLNSLRP